jgi:glycosyltransferase involved in cell wall biosynthesis
MSPTASIVIPAYNEGESIRPLLEAITRSVSTEIEVLVVFDDANDTTAPVVRAFAQQDTRFKPTLNTYGRGPAPALRYGIDHAASRVAVVMMADGSDDPDQVDDLIRLVNNGNVIAAASRYMTGGRQVGGALVKRTLSRLAGLSLRYLARVGTHDATNSFKAYSKDFVSTVGIESEKGFEIGIELVAKARRARLSVAEIPTIWRDRTDGESRFRIVEWLPHYLRWYMFAFGRPLTPEEIGARGERTR